MPTPRPRLPTDTRRKLRDEVKLTRLLLARAIARTQPGAMPASFGPLDDIEATVASLASTIMRRLAVSRAAGAPMPLDRLRSMFGLSATELRVVATLAVLEMNAELRELARFVSAESSARTA